MEAQEIKDVILAGGEWYRRDGELQNNDVIIGIVYDEPDDRGSYGTAICTAINATYGQNIDPSKVKEMYNMLVGLSNEAKLYEHERIAINHLLNSATLK